MNPADISALTQARNTAQSAGQSAVEFNAGGATLADELRSAISERFNQSPVAQQAAQARGDFLQAGPDARQGVADLIAGGNILSPTQQQQILGQQRAAALVPVMGANIMQEAGFGTLEDLINAGVNAWDKQARYQQGMAQLAQQNYGGLLDELMGRSQLEQRAQELAFQKQMQPLELAYRQAQIAATNRSNQGSATKPTQYPFEEPYIELGLAGKPVSAAGDKYLQTQFPNTNYGTSQTANAKKDKAIADAWIAQNTPQPSFWDTAWNWLQGK